MLKQAIYPIKFMIYLFNLISYDSKLVVAEF